MIQSVVIEAEKQGELLSNGDIELLNSSRPTNVSGESESRLLLWVGKIIERERLAGDFYEEDRTFSNAIEWAGDREYPYVVELAERYFCENPGLQPKGGLLKDKLYLLITGVVLVVLMFLVVAIVGFLTDK